MGRGFFFFRGWGHFIMGFLGKDKIVRIIQCFIEKK